MSDRYQVMSCTEAKAAGYAGVYLVGGEEDDWYGYVVDTHEKKALGGDGGEPEDQTFGRDWAWVAPALNASFLKGMEAMQNQAARKMDTTGAATSQGTSAGDVIRRLPIQEPSEQAK